MPSSATYRSRFGSLVRAYQLVGYATDRDYRYLETNRALRALHPRVVEQTVAGIRALGAKVRVDPATDLLTINEEFTASLSIVRCATHEGRNRWKIRLDTGLRPDITIAARMAPGNEAVGDYYLLPWIDMGNAARLAATRQSDLANASKPKKVAGMTADQMARMEREMESLTKDFRALEASYGDDVLHLVIASGYLSRLVGNPEIERYMRARHPEILDEFRAIIAAASLDRSIGGATDAAEA